MKTKMNTISGIALLLVIFITGLLTEKATAQMFWSNACSFAGNPGSYISRGNSASLNLTGSFTIEAWIKPAVATMTGTILQKREGNNASGYGMYMFNGRVAIRTNANTRLISKTVLPVNEWTHVSGVYNSASGLFSIAVNAVSDTSATIAGAAPIAGTDSLFIGTGYNNSFNGELDEVRIWNRNLGSGSINNFRKTSLGTSSGKYHGLVLSLTFQDRHSDGGGFSLNDQSEYSNHFVNRGATAVDLSNRPSDRININDCIRLNGVDDYLAAPDSPALSPTGVVTLEAWIHPKSFGTSNVIIHKGPDNGAVTNYGLILNQGYLQATVNNLIQLTSSETIPLNKWTHIAYVCNGLTGKSIFYINGDLTDSSQSPIGLITNGNDSLYIGGTIALNEFEGFIDEVRIKQALKSLEEINRYMFQSIDESNGTPGIETVFNFDGYAVSNAGTATRLYFRNNAGFSHPSSSSNIPVSPLNRADGMNFQDGYYLKKSDRRIPAEGTSGLMITDTLDVIYNDNIIDINVFIGLNHTYAGSLSITLFAPSGQSAVLFQSHSLATQSENIVSIFDDQADDPIVNGTFLSFAPLIKPSINLNSAFSGTGSHGKWRLVINDADPNDTGRLYGWGIQVNNRTFKTPTLSCAALIQGFYEPNTNSTVRDTMFLYLRKSIAPYNLVDSSKGYLQWTGHFNHLFNTAKPGVPYYIQLKHRNSIETWSSEPIIIDPLNACGFYEFFDLQERAFGANMINVDQSPQRFALYSGDVNQTGEIDLDDVLLTYNDANSFAAGYVPTDVNGNSAVDLADVLFTYNNSTAFVTVMKP